MSNLFSRNRTRLVAGAVLVSGLAIAGYAFQSQGQSGQKASVSSDQPEVAGESTAAPSTVAPTASPTPTVKSSTVRSDDGTTSVTIDNSSSQSGNAKNFNSTESTVTINGQTTTVSSQTTNSRSTTVINGVEQ